jgi:hypothetical protein
MKTLFKHRSIKINALPLFILSLVLMGGLLSYAPARFNPLTGKASAACLATAPPTTYGQVKQTVNVATAGTYRVWSRIKAPDTTNNSYYFQTDTGACAYNVGDSASIPANTWKWVNYQDASTASTINVTLTAGAHTFIYTGKEANVELDKVMLLVDTTCVPVDTATTFGDNCATTDTNGPTVQLTAPVGGSTITSLTTISATASDPSGVAKVDFLVDGNVVNSDTTSAYSYQWDSSTVANGTHTIVAKAYDTIGNSTSSSPITVTTNNKGTDTTKPTVSLTAPAAGTTVTAGTAVTISATAADNVGVTKVEFYDGATLLNTDTASPYTYSWSTTGATSGAHSITAKAYDAAGNNMTSTAVSITVNGTTTGQPDLVVTGISYSPATPATGNAVTFNVTIKNQGTVATAAGTVVGIGTTVDGVKSVWSDNNSTSLAAGASRVQSTNGGPTGATIGTWMATTGTHTIAATVDDASRIAESNETNNTFSTSLTVGTGADTQAPTVSLTAPANGSSTAVGTAVNITATAADNVGVTKVEFYVDGVLKTSDTATPYAYSWATTGVAAGAHSLTAKAYDAANNVTTSGAVSVTLTSTTVGNGDVNGDGRVNAIDLSSLISHDGQNYAPADFNHDGTVGAADMAILLSKWTW